MLHIPCVIPMLLAILSAAYTAPVAFAEDARSASPATSKTGERSFGDQAVYVPNVDTTTLEGILKYYQLYLQYHQERIRVLTKGEAPTTPSLLQTNTGALTAGAGSNEAISTGGRADVKSASQPQPPPAIARKTSDSIIWPKAKLGEGEKMIFFHQERVRSMLFPTQGRTEFKELLAKGNVKELIKYHQKKAKECKQKIEQISDVIQSSP